MNLFVFSGQSNMQGQTEAVDNTPAVKGGYEYRYLTDSVVPCKNPAGESVGRLLLASDQQRGSLVPAFIGRWVALTGEEAMAVHAARGATCVGDWLPGNTVESTARYHLLVEKVLCARKQAGEGKTYFIWLQGESDALADTSEKDYMRDMTRFKELLKKDIGQELFGIIQVGYFAYLFGNDDKDERIQLAQQKLTETDSDFVMLTKEAPRLSRDPIYLNPEAAGHFGNKGLQYLGERAAEGLFQAVHAQD